MAHGPYDYAARRGVRPVSWQDFHGLCRALALSVSGFAPELLLPVARGGNYPGTLLAHMLQVEIYPVRLTRRANDVVVSESPQWIAGPPAEVTDRRVLVVDEMCDSGETLREIRAQVTALGARSVRTAVLYAHTWGAHVPDYIGLITDDLILNPWDREILRDGVFQFHPEYAEALARQGIAAGAHLLIAAPGFELAKG